MVVLCRVQSVQQFQALQAQYSGAYPTPHFHNPEGPTGPGPLLNTFHPEATVDEEEAGKPAKRMPMFLGVVAVPADFLLIWLFWFFFSCSQKERETGPTQGTQTPKGPQGTQTPESPQGTQTPEGPQATQTPESPQGTQTPEGPQGTQTPKSPQGTQTSQGPERT